MAEWAETLKHPEQPAIGAEAPESYRHPSPSRVFTPAPWRVLLVLAALASSCTSGTSQADTESTNATLSPTTVLTTTSTTVLPSSNPTIIALGDLGSIASTPISLEYLSQTEQRWSLDLARVKSINLNDEFDLNGISIGVTVEASFTYEGDSAAGKLLDLVIELETPSGLVDAVRAPCSPRPKDSIDLFASVPAGETKAGVLCFQTDQRPTALLITPLLGETVRVELPGA